MGKRYNLRSIRAMLGARVSKQSFTAAIKAKRIPAPSTRSGEKTPSWPLSDVSAIAKVYGFLEPPKNPICVTVYAQKGGVFKTTIAFNLARIAALHGIRTCIVGVDPQGDITNLCGSYGDEDKADTLDDLRELSMPPTLYDVYNRRVKLNQTLQQTDLDTLWIIPEDDNLTQLDIQLTSQRSGRERWISKLVRELKNNFELVVVDCPPTWNITVSNAIVAADTLIVPLECKPGQFRNLDSFCELLDEFIDESPRKEPLSKVFVPTCLNSTRKLSSAICASYRQQLDGVTQEVVREATHMEKANFALESIIEFAPTSDAANRMRDLLPEIFERLEQSACKAA